MIHPRWIRYEFSSPWDLFADQLAAWWVPKRLRALGLRIQGENVSPTARVYPRTRVYGRGLSLGEGVFINSDCLIEAGAPVSIGDRASLGRLVHIVTATHALGPGVQRAGAIDFKPVNIGNGCWIGARSTILPGVTIHEGCVVAAGSVVIEDCRPNGLYAGVPATRRRDLYP